MHCLMMPKIVSDFKKKADRLSSVSEAIDLAFNFNARRFKIAPAQVREEISSLLDIVGKIKPKTVVEIGTAKGGTLFLFTRVSNPDATIVSIDLPSGPFGGGYPKCASSLYRSFAVSQQEILLMRADSHQTETVEELRKTLAERAVDFLFIDGDHRYEGVKKDFEMYSPLVRKGGIIAFHDICPGPPETVGGVPLFWDEVKGKYQSQSIIKDREQGGFGIGVLSP